MLQEIQSGICPSEEHKEESYVIGNVSWTTSCLNPSDSPDITIWNGKSRLMNDATFPTESGYHIATRLTEDGRREITEQAFTAMAKGEARQIVEDGKGRLKTKIIPTPVGDLSVKDDGMLPMSTCNQKEIRYSKLVSNEWTGTVYAGKHEAGGSLRNEKTGVAVDYASGADTSAESPETTVIVRVDRCPNHSREARSSERSYCDPSQIDCLKLDQSSTTQILSNLPPTGKLIFLISACHSHLPLLYDLYPTCHSSPFSEASL